MCTFRKISLLISEKCFLPPGRGLNIRNWICWKNRKTEADSRAAGRSSSDQRSDWRSRLLINRDALLMRARLLPVEYFWTHIFRTWIHQQMEAGLNLHIFFWGYFPELWLNRRAEEPKFSVSSRTSCGMFYLWMLVSCFYKAQQVIMHTAMRKEGFKSALQRAAPTWGACCLLLTWWVWLGQ